MKPANQEIKEDFCVACLALPLAFAGAGASAYGVGSKGKHKLQKKIMLWGGLLIVVLSVIIGITYAMKCKNCR